MRRDDLRMLDVRGRFRSVSVEKATSPQRLVDNLSDARWADLDEGGAQARAHVIWSLDLSTLDLCSYLVHDLERCART